MVRRWAGGNTQRGFDRGFDNRGALGGNRSFDNRQSFNAGNGTAGNGTRFGNRSFAPQATPQVQDRGARFGSQSFQRSDAGRQDRFANRGNFQRDSGARPQYQPHNDGGNRNNGGHQHGRSR